MSVSSIESAQSGRDVTMLTSSAGVAAYLDEFGACQRRAAARARLSRAREAAITGSFRAWLLQTITDLRLNRRRAQWRRYGRSAKGRRRTRRYIATPKGQRVQTRYALSVKGSLRHVRANAARRAGSL